jgi:2-C-methyl-D-erythritol 4-phosphate cytidylyltransferase
MNLKLIDNLLKIAKSSTANHCSAVIAAAGSSTRMGGENKILAEIDGVPVIVRTLTVFQNCPCVDEIVIVTKEDSIVPIADLCAKYSLTKVSKVVCGGKERVDSVLIGVTETSDSAKYIAVHDGARPFVTEEIISDTLEMAVKYHAAAPAVPVNDTVKVVSSGIVQNTLDRSTLRAIQTPQIFDASILKAALLNAKKKELNITDDCSAVEAMGVTVHLTEGSFENIKITTVNDYAIGEAIINRRKDNENRTRL